MKTMKIALALALAVPSLGAAACATTRPVSEQSDDNIITGRVGRRLTADPEVKRYQIDVDTLDGVVTLRGKVESETMKASAEKIARDTDGVRNVVNELMVEDQEASDRREENNADLNVKTAVGRALTGDDDVRRVNVDVDVVDGVVTLSGVVHNEAEAAEAERLAREVEGVKDVKNELKVEQKTEGDPEKMGKVDDDGDRDQPGKKR
jgi:hyperosmotically inducible periplasmic protein